MLAGMAYANVHVTSYFFFNIIFYLFIIFLQEPVWLNMMTHSSHHSHLCEKFMVQFIDCLRIGNSRETNL